MYHLLSTICRKICNIFIYYSILYKVCISFKFKELWKGYYYAFYLSTFQYFSNWGIGNTYFFTVCHLQIYISNCLINLTIILCRITAMCGDYYIGGREFESLSDLIGYYTTFSDLLKGQKLTHPVPPPKVGTSII